ncbi:MAG: hypothetical protein Ct9H300mP16_06380 [Pseudomonadota bacterium]|nr:MAG: hypothetical protein Ct9H300mP16_06380 [Pseudomonadota bacterium]
MSFTLGPIEPCSVGSSQLSPVSLSVSEKRMAYGLRRLNDFSLGRVCHDFFPPGVSLD